MQSFEEAVKSQVLLYDGAKGVLLQQEGAQAHETVESKNLYEPEVVRAVYARYRQAGSDVLQTNTFSGNRIALAKHGLDQVAAINKAGVTLAREVAGPDGFVAACVGPTGLFMQPAGPLSFEEAYAVFAEQMTAIQGAGATLLHLETFSDVGELRAALLAARDHTDLPVIVSATFQTGGKTLLGHSAESFAIVAQNLGAVIVGANCSGGPKSLLEPLQRMRDVTTLPLMVKPNAGMPQVRDGATVFTETPEAFAAHTEAFVRLGVRLIGGCCGTTPAHIDRLRRELTRLESEGVSSVMGMERQPPRRVHLASSYHHVDLAAMEIKTCDRLSFLAKEFPGFRQTGAVDELLDAVLDFETQGRKPLFLDFTDLDLREETGAFVSQFSLLCKRPIIISARSETFLLAFLRVYPGRAAVLLLPGQEALAAQARGLGAVVLRG